MRRLILLAALAGLAVLAPAAQASFHLETVNEVMTAGPGGAAGVQFVELLDLGGAEESFPAAEGPYTLRVYDAAGHRVGAQSLGAAGLARHAAARTPLLVSTTAADAALGVTGDQRLTAALPVTAGQACYTVKGTPFSCVTWGCVAQGVKAAGFTGTQMGAAPPAGSSVQRGRSGRIGIAPPTPLARNAAVAPAAACPGGPMAFAGVRIAARHIAVHRARAQLRLACPPRTRASCRGRVALRFGPNHRRAGAAAFHVAAGRTRTIGVTLSRAAAAAYRQRHHLGVTATLQARDGAGRQRTRHVALTLGGAPSVAPAPY